MTSCPIGADTQFAARLLRAGKLVAFGTETVYGLGGHALDPVAAAGIFAAKGRPKFDPLIVHVPDLAAVEALVVSMPAAALQLARSCWPGPLTLVLPKRAVVPDLVTAGLPTVAIRVPRHPLALELLRTAAIPIAAPSANLFGRVSPTTAAHVAEQLGDRIDYILDGGPCGVGVESTVLQFVNERPMLLRPGGYTVEELEAIAGPIGIAASTSRPAEAPQQSPGMLAQHYAPRTPLLLVDVARLATREKVEDVLRSELGEVPRRIGLLTLGPLPLSPHSCFERIEVLSEEGNLTEATAGFFAAVRRLDAAGLDAIIATPFPPQGLGRALNDRLQRAAANAGLENGE